MCVNIEAASQPAHDPDHDEDQELFRGIRELHAVASAEHRHDGLLILKHYGEEAEGDGSNDGGEEPAPVVPHGEVDAGHLDAEEDAPDGRGKATGDAHSAGSF